TPAGGPRAGPFLGIVHDAGLPGSGDGRRSPAPGRASPLGQLGEQVGGAVAVVAVLGGGVPAAVPAAVRRSGELALPVLAAVGHLAVHGELLGQLSVVRVAEHHGAGRGVGEVLVGDGGDVLGAEGLQADGGAGRDGELGSLRLGHAEEQGGVAEAGGDQAHLGAAFAVGAVHGGEGAVRGVPVEHGHALALRVRAGEELGALDLLGAHLVHGLVAVEADHGEVGGGALRGEG